MIEEKIKEIWKVTDDGLLFFLEEFSIKNDEYGFRACDFKNGLQVFPVDRNEKNPSGHLFKNKLSGKWTFTDLGVSNKPLNAIEYIVDRDNCTFILACHLLCSQFNIK